MSFDSWLEPPDPAPEGECPECEGAGKIKNEDFTPNYSCDCVECDCVERLETVECYRCDGSGEVELEVCDGCNSYHCHCDADYEAWKDSR